MTQIRGNLIPVTPCTCRLVPRVPAVARRGLQLSPYIQQSFEAPKSQQTRSHSLDKLSSRRTRGTKVQAAGGDVLGDLEPSDANELTTALNKAIAAEDYKLASTLRDKLRQLSGSDAGPPADWQNLGIPTWLADRAEHIGYRFPTGAILPL